MSLDNNEEHLQQNQLSSVHAYSASKMDCQVALVLNTCLHKEMVGKGVAKILDWGGGAKPQITQVKSKKGLHNPI